jgi:Na+:H+ antiporter, NhaA family
VLTAWLQYILRHSLLLVLGALAALVWANVSPESYGHLVHLPLLQNPYFGTAGGAGRVIDLHYLVNDVLMALFFALAGKEVWEAMLPGGPLRDVRAAANPLFATLGGMAGPALVYLLGAGWIGRFADLSQGWAIPCATDIAFSYFVARMVLGDGHPAIAFLLLLAIADDALGLIILAIFYPVDPVQPVWLLLAVAAVAGGVALRRAGVTSFWVYLLGPGALSWVGFALSGLHPALALLPIIPTLPHAYSDLGIYMIQELRRHDTLTELEHWWKNPVEGILGVFALLNGGVVLGAIGAPTGLVLAGLWLGKPLGIYASSWIATRLGFSLPAEMTQRDLWVVGCAAAIGFTVALFVSVVAFPPGEVQDAAKMGALLSIGAALLTFIAGRVLRIQKRPGVWKTAPAGY